MGFATKWLAEKALFPQLFKETPDNLTGIIAVIPAYNEPGITTLLDSLAACNEPCCGVEIIIIVNLKQEADREVTDNNRKCIDNIDTWKKANHDCYFRLFVFDAGKPTIPGWGVGLARKTGMDEAVRRFDAIDRPDGAIVCLDADCTVEKNYFEAIAENLLANKKNSACSIYFEHPLGNDCQNDDLTKHIILYELHLRYYVSALKYTGFPYAYHTVGSAIAVKALQYVKAGGMNRRQAGEDFYFVQKLVPSGGYFTLNSTTVYPSPRESLRVPFGTGAAMSRLMKKEDDQFLTYSFDAFRELKSLFDSTGEFYKVDNQAAANYYMELPAGLKAFISKEEWILRTGEVNSNTYGYKSFIKRFFGWFNMFRIVKYLNCVHNGIFEKKPVPESANELLRSSGHDVTFSTPADLLSYFRIMDKRS